MKILAALSWIPDRIMVPLQYKIHTGRWIDFKNPKRYTEKLQLYKLYYRNEDMLKCTDKFHVREYLESIGMGHILIPLIGHYSSVEEIDYEKLPNQFVAKSSDGGGGGQVLVCRDKSTLSELEFKETVNSWMNLPKPRKSFGREWAYENKYPRTIVIEELIAEPGTTDLKDYKFMCFDGVARLVYGIYGRTLGNGANFGFYSRDFKELKVSRSDERKSEQTLPKPNGYENMLAIAEELSSHFPHVRVDLYNIDGRVYFGELTFYDGSGYLTYNPDSFDFELGNYFKNYR